MGLAALLLTWMVLGPRGAPWSNRTTVYAAFDQLGALRTGANVRLAGRTVGVVTEIGGAPAGGARRWRVTLSVDRAVLHDVAQNSLAIITPQGVLGKPMLEIAPPPGAPVGRLGDMANPVLEGVDPASLDRTLDRLYRHSGLILSIRDELRPKWRRFTKALDDVDVALAATDEASREHALQAWATLQRASGYWDVVAPEARRTVATWTQTRGSATHQLAGAEASADELASLWAQSTARLNEGDRQAMARIKALLANAGAAIADVAWLQTNAVALMAQAENGTALRILNDPELYDLLKLVAEQNSNAPWRLIGHPDDGATDRDAWRKQFDVPSP